MKEASFYKTIEKNRIQCYLCPHNCIISDGKRGICNVRLNLEGVLFSEVYDRPVAIHSDPIEKKPLYHFHPGSQILSIGTAGCNMKCFYCQNCDISQQRADIFDGLKMRTSEEIVEIAMEKPDNIGVAYTYNEPTVYFEYMYAIATLVQKQDMVNVVVTNGFINRDPLSALMEVTDAFNVDIKAFNDGFYRRHTASRIAPVLSTIEALAASGKHLELTNLIIPGLNDNEREFREMLKWIRNETTESTVLHLSKYFPSYRSNIASTSETVMARFYDIAKEYLSYVYLGNVKSNKAKDTYCPYCGELVISRSGYRTRLSGMKPDGSCVNCGRKIINNG